jgi:hypothetical protein
MLATTGDRLESSLRWAIRIENPGLVYYIGDGNGQVKIGWSKNPHARLKIAQTFNPDTVMLGLEPGDRNLEYRRHYRFRAQHVRQEWFWNKGALAEHIKLLKKSETELGLP